jgi:translation machinery-associated protein 16
MVKPNFDFMLFCLVENFHNIIYFPIL